ncbi:glucosyltransferase [Saccharopolyspora griseoalba]|uniref:Glucosyltransferase n=1 Tax=Saccharopolyspora griseoalba TaxID=1431848 RepID=A0ABW2LKX3_9PSEU
MLSAGWVLLAAWLQLVRGSGLGAADVVWAEDGGVFLDDALRTTTWQALTAPHAGYLQLVARLAAEPVSLLPPTRMATGLAVVAALVVGLVSLLVWFASARVLAAPWARVLATALVPLLPQAGFEVNASVANLHWYLAYAAFWILLASPRSTRGRIAGAAVGALAVLSDPLAVLVLPAALVGAALRHRVALATPAAMLLALVPQVHAYSQTTTMAWAETRLGDLPRIYGLRVLTSGAVGDRALGPVYEQFGTPVVALVSAGVLAVLAALAARSDRAARLTAAVAIEISVLYLCVPVGVRGGVVGGTGALLDRDPFSLGGSRYTIVPILLLWVAVLVLADSTTRRWRGGRALPVAAGIAALLVAQLLGDWAGASVRSRGPVWVADVQRAAAICREPRHLRPPQVAPVFADPPGADEVVITVAPQVGADPFGVVLPCSVLS